MSDLVKFLRARIAEDEREHKEVAEKCRRCRGPWPCRGILEVWAKRGILDQLARRPAPPVPDEETFRHMAALGTDDDTAEHRRKIEEFRDSPEAQRYEIDNALHDFVAWHAIAGFLALPYKRHGDYRKQWRP